MIAQDIQADQFRTDMNVSRETFEMYKLFVNHLSHWNKKINLVSKSTISNFWLRHAMDSSQLVRYIPNEAKRCIDLGSGAGLPGLALAIELRDRAGVEVTMVESNGKKCNFLRTLIRELKLPARVIQQRIEEETYDVITARALAPLSKLLLISEKFWSADTVGIFPKGMSWEREIEEAKPDWNISIDTPQSITDADARILLVKNLFRKTKNHRVGEFE